MRLISSLLAVALASSMAFAGDWVSVDIGTSTAGTTTAVGATGLDIVGSGSDIWGNSDGFRYVYKEVSGDFSIKVRVSSLSPTNEWSKAGVMVRQSLAADSAHAMMVCTPSSNGFAFQWRDAAGNASSHVAGGAVAYPNSWVRLVRVDGKILAYKATDAAGTNFAQVGSPLALNLAGPVLVGLCVTAHDDGQLCTAEFRDLAFETLPPATGTGLLGEYFDEMDLSVLKVVRVDPTVDFGGGAPHERIDPDTFSIRWTGSVQARFSEEYTFSVYVDNGVRLWIGGALVIDDWNDVVPHEVSGKIALVAGQKNDIRLEFFENWGGECVKLYWASTSQNKEIVPQQRLYPPEDNYPPTLPSELHASLLADRTVILGWLPSTDDTLVARYDVYRDGQYIGWTCELTYRDTNLTPQTTYAYSVQAADYTGKLSAMSDIVSVTTHSLPTLGTGSGLLGQYYNDISFGDRQVVRTDATLNFDWGYGSPDAAIDPDTFSVRWEGQIQPLYSELYTFYTVTDDGIRLWVNGQVVANNFTDHAATENNGQIWLQAGMKYDIRVDFYENGGLAVAKLLWESPSQPKEVVPTTQLYPAQFLAGASIALLTPVESPVSPAWVEVRCSEDVTAITYSLNGGSMLSGTRENPKQWYVNTATSQGLPYGIPLNLSAATALSVTATDGTATQTTDYSLVWSATKLNGKSWSQNEIVIRANDSLLFTVEDTGPGAGKGNKNGIVKIDCDGNGTVDYHGAPDVKTPWKYTTPGHYTVTAWLRGKECGTMTVTVIDVNLDGPIACEVGYKRDKGVEVTPSDASASISWTSNDESLLGVSLKEPTSYGAKLYVTAVRRGTPILQARVGGDFGALVRQHEVDELTVECPNREVITTDYDTGISRAVIYLKPYVPNLDVSLSIYGGTATFAGGATSLTASSSDFGIDIDSETGEDIGMFVFDIERTSTSSSWCFEYSFSQTTKYDPTITIKVPINASHEVEVKVTFTVDKDNPKKVTWTISATAFHLDKGKRVQPGTPATITETSNGWTMTRLRGVNRSFPNTINGGILEGTWELPDACVPGDFVEVRGLIHIKGKFTCAQPGCNAKSVPFDAQVNTLKPGEKQNSDVVKRALP